MLFVYENSIAQQRSFGLGVIVGEPTGVSAKLWTSPTRAFVFGAGWSIGGDRIGAYNGNYDGGGRIHFHADYLLHMMNVFSSDGQYPMFYGVGLRLNTGGGYYNSFAVRFIAGIAWQPLDSSIDIFLEFVPSLQLTSDSKFGLDSAVGARYYF
jgi:hypothetical protein